MHMSQRSPQPAKLHKNAGLMGMTLRLKWQRLGGEITATTDCAFRPGHLRGDQTMLLRAAGHPASWPRGSVLVREGEDSGSTFLIERGQVKVTVSSRTGYTTLLAIRGPGELVGELSALDSCRRSATVTAVSAVQAIVIPAVRFRDLLESHSELALAVLKSVVGRLRDSDRRRAEYGGHNARTRVAYLLVEMAERHGIASPQTETAKVIAVTQQELAGAAGTSRESVVRSLRELHRDGLVETLRGKVIVLDPNLLAESVHGLPIMARSAGLCVI